MSGFSHKYSSLWNNRRRDNRESHIFSYAPCWSAPTRSASLPLPQGRYPYPCCSRAAPRNSPETAGVFLYPYFPQRCEPFLSVSSDSGSVPAPYFFSVYSLIYQKVPFFLSFSRNTPIPAALFPDCSFSCRQYWQYLHNSYFFILS